MGRRPTKKNEDARRPCRLNDLGRVFNGALVQWPFSASCHNLAKDNLLTREFALVGFARPEMTTEKLRASCSGDIQQFATVFEPLRETLLTKGDFFMHLADMRSYTGAQGRVARLWADDDE
jgi:hypothetical protein